MSIDYNEKFKELRKKISILSEQNNETSKNKNYYKNRIKQLELNSEQKIDTISKKVNSLKNDFIKLHTIYNLEHNKNINKYNSFYYPSSQKEELDEKKLFIKNLSNQISEQISTNSKEIQNDIYLKFYEMENRIKGIFNKKREEKKYLKKEIIMLAGEFKNNLENLNQNIENKRIQEEKIVININENFRREINNTNLTIKEMQRINEQNENVYINKIKEMNNWITDNFRKEKRKRENFQENVMNILKETCQKLSDDFYKNNDINNYNEEDNSEIHENEFYDTNNNINNNNLYKYNEIENNNINIEINQNQNQEKEEQINNNNYEENNINFNNNYENNMNNINFNNEDNEMLKEQNEQDYEEYIENEGEENYEEEYEKYPNNDNELYNEEEAIEENNENNYEENENEELKEEEEIKE